MSFEGHGVALRGRRWLLVLGGALEVVGLLIIARHFLDWRAQGWLFTGGTLCSFAPLVIGAYWWSMKKWPRRAPVRLRADAAGLRIESAFVPRKSLTAGFVLANPEHAVRIVRAGRLSEPIDMELATRDKALELLHALGLGVAHATARFQAVYGGIKRRAIATGAAMFAYLAVFYAAMIVADHFTGRGLPAGSLVLFMMGSSTFSLLMQLVLLTTVDVGADGIWLSKGNTFLPYAELQQATIEQGDIVLTRTGKRPIRLGFGGLLRQEEARVACLQRIEEARAAFARGGAPVSPEALLSPGGRSTGQWLKALRAVADYRSSAVPGETLWRIVEDPSAAAPTRAGAAVALARTLDDGARQRLRVAAQACAAPRLRVAFELVAEEAQVDEVRLEDALDDVAKAEAGRG